MSEFIFTPRQGDTVREEVPGFSMERAELEAFADAISGGAPYPVTADEAVNGIAALDAIVQSAEAGGAVSI